MLDSFFNSAEMLQSMGPIRPINRYLSNMHIDLAAMVHQYGYAAILLGALLEGETILILGGFAAHQGYLALTSVMTLAALGGFMGVLSH